MTESQEQLRLGVATPSADDAPSGLTYEPEAISPLVERDLLRAIDQQPWLASLQRRVQHYGWRYDYKSRRIQPDAYLGPLPSFLDPVVRLIESAYGFRPDQAIVNEYVPGQGIAPHVDCEPCFGPVVVMLGLGGNVQMDFAHRATDRTWTLLFERRGLLVLSGDGRYAWLHSIARRRSDPTYGIRRTRRVSITFRSIVTDVNDRPPAQRALT